MQSVDFNRLYDVPEKDVLVLNYTMACPLSCSFCCYGCNPDRKEKMSVDQARDLIVQASRIESISSVAFTGGEVFLFPNELVQLSELLAEVGLPFTVATAGHWGASPATARALARTLVENGLRRANISFDPAHAAFVPAASVVTAAQAFTAMGVPVYIISTLDGPEDGIGDGLDALRSDALVHFREKRIAKVGRGKRAIVDYSDISPEERPTTCYRQVHHDIVVFWDGKTYPCCSTFNRATQGLVLGNAFAEPLAAIVERIHGSMLVRVMKRYGADKVEQIVRDYDPELLDRLPRLRDFPGACSYCNKLLLTRDSTRDLMAVFARYEADFISDLQDKVVGLLGEQQAATVLETLI